MISALKYAFTTDRRDNINEYNRDIITRLKFIGTFMAGEKIDVKNLRIESNSILDCIDTKLSEFLLLSILIEFFINIPFL